MPVRHDDDPRNGRPQIDGHNVTEYEVEAVTGSSNGRPSRRGGVRIAAGVTASPTARSSATKRRS